MVLTAVMAVCLRVGAQPREPEPQNGDLTPAILRALGLERERIVVASPHVWTLTNGFVVYSSKPYGENIYGYAGTIPLFIAVQGDVIVAIVAADNKETPQRFKLAEPLLAKWKGKSLKKAAKLNPDAISGATMSSRALIKTVQATAQGVVAGKKQERKEKKRERKEGHYDGRSGATGR